MKPEHGVVVWVTSPSIEPAREVAAAVGEALSARDLPVEVLHTDRPDLEGIATPAALASLAGLLAGRGVSSVVAEASSSRTERDAARRRIGSMIEVLVTAPPSPGTAWQSPTRAEVEIDAAAGVSRVLRTLEVLGYVQAGGDQAYSAAEEREVLKRLKAFGYL